MSNYERTLFRGDGEFPDELLPAVDLRILAGNAYSSSLDWGATPLNSYHDPVLGERQKEVREALEQRVHAIPEGVGEIPDDIQRYVAESFLWRFNGRTMANIDNFSRRLHADATQFDAADRMVLEKAMWGQATPAELMYARCKFGMASIELGCITHPYGAYTDNLEEMQDAVREAMEMFGAQPLGRDELENVFKVKWADNMANGKKKSSTVQRAFMVTRKRNYGELPDGTTIRERSSFIVRIDPDSDFDQKIAQNMQKVHLVHNPDAMKHLAIAGKIDQTIPPFIRDKVFGTVIPLSTTMYAFNRTTEERIQERDQMRREELLVRRQRETEEDASHEGDQTAADAAMSRSLGSRLLGLVRLPRV